MAMSCWTILEIEATKDLKAIKKAYAVKLKQLNPDEQPAEFQQIKEAFDTAVNYAKGNSATQLFQPMFEQAQPEQQEPLAEEPEVETVTSVLEKQPIPDLKEGLSFQEQVLQLFAGKEFFDDFDAWKKMLSENQSWSINEFMVNSRFIQQVLVDHFIYLEKPIIKLLFQTFQLAELQGEVIENQLVYPDFLRMRETIALAPDFSFALWRELPVAERLNYFTYRYEFYQYLNREDRQPVRLKELYKKANELYNQDGDFFILRALDVLISVSGDLDRADALDEFSHWLHQSEPMPRQNLASVLRIYERVWRTAELSAVDLERLDGAERLLPSSWANALLGTLYWKAGEASRAFRQWKYASRYQLIAVWPRMRKLFKQLTPTEQQEYQQIRRFYQLEVETKSPALNKHAQKPLRTVFAIVALILVVMGVTTIFAQREPRAVEKPDFSFNQTLMSEMRDNMQDNFSAKALIAEDADAAQRFVYYYFCSDDQAERLNFIDEYVTGDAVVLMNQHLADPASHPDAGRYDFSFESDYTSTDGYCRSVTYDEEVLLVVKMDEDKRIIDIFGSGWHEVEPAIFEALLDDINVRPIHSLSFLMSHYLVSDDRAAVLEQYPQYVTEELMGLLEKRAAEPANTKYESGTWQMSRVDEKSYVVVNDNNDRPGMILDFDHYGHLAHIYLDGWEEMDQKTADQIFENCEEDKNGIF